VAPGWAIDLNRRPREQQRPRSLDRRRNFSTSDCGAMKVKVKKAMKKRHIFVKIL